MTITDLPARSTLPGGRSPGHWRLGAVIAVLVLVLAGAAALTLRSFDHRYGPIQRAPFGGPYTHRNWVFSRDGFSESLNPEAGTAARYITGISNLGSHPVTVNSIDTTDVVTAISWSDFHLRPGGDVTGVHTRWRTFPATVPAHGTIRLLLTIRHPDNCAAYPSLHGQKLAFLDGVLEVHWRSLLHRHTTASDVLTDSHIGVC